MKYLYLNIDLANDAVQTREKLEALAFAIMIKNRFTSSTVKNATVRNCKKLFKIGSTRASRAINNGIKYEYIRRDGGLLIANRIKHKGYNIKLDVSGKNLNGVMDTIRKSVLLNYIKVHNLICDTLKSARNPKNLLECKRARRRLSWSMRNIRDYGEYGTSMAKVERITQTKRTKARKLIKSLAAEKKIIVKHRAVKTDINPKYFYRDFAELEKQNKARGYLFRYKGAIYRKQTNLFVYNCSDICKI